MSNFDEYIRQGEPGRSVKAAAWQTAIGLQDVDGLKTSSYLIDTAKRHIEHFKGTKWHFECHFGGTSSITAP